MSQHSDQFKSAQEQRGRIRWDQIRSHSLLPHLTEDLRELFSHPDASNSWSNAESEERMNSFANGLNRFESLAYMLAFGYTADPWRNGDLSASFHNSEDDSTFEKLGAFVRHSARIGMIKKYSVSFEESELTDDQFFSHLNIEAFYNRDVDIYRYWEVSNIAETVNGQVGFATIQNEDDVEHALYKHVHQNLHHVVHLIMDTSDIKEAMTNDAFDFLKRKGVIEVPDGHENNRSHPVSAIGFYESSGRVSILSHGITYVPDLVIAYSTRIMKKMKRKPVSVGYSNIGASALGEVKGPWLQLADSLETLKKLLNIPDQQSTEEDRKAHDWFVLRIAERAKPKIGGSDEEISDSIDKNGSNIPQEVKNAAALFENIIKLITTALHAGVSRVILMDLNDFLFIDINADLKLSNINYSNPDFPALLKCKHKIMHRSHEHLRAIILAYLAPTRPMADALADYKKLVPLFLRRDLEVFRERRLKLHPPPKPLLTNPLPSKQVSTLCPNSTVFKFHESLLRKKYFVKFGEALKAYVRNKRGLHSQVLEVHPKEFLTPFLENPTLFSNPPQNQSCILKVYDPAWIKTLGDSEPTQKVDIFLPKMFRLAGNELKVYERLAPLMGSVIPKVYSYGDLLDVTILGAQAYDVFTGPYILMEMLEEKKTLLKTDVNEEFVETKVIPQFQRLHQMGVVHDDIRLSNLIFTPEGDVKIIDFSHSYFSEKKSAFAKEIEEINRYFERQRKFGEPELIDDFCGPGDDFGDYWEYFDEC